VPGRGWTAAKSVGWLAGQLIFPPASTVTRRLSKENLGLHAAEAAEGEDQLRSAEVAHEEKTKSFNGLRWRGATSWVSICSLARAAGSP